MKKSLLILRLSAAALSLLLCVGTLTFLGPCVHEDGTFGTCHWAGVICSLLGGVLALLSLLSLCRWKGAFSEGLNAAAAAVAAALFPVPGMLIPLCMMSTMRCLSVMQPAVRILSAAIAVLSLVAAISGLRQRSGK